MGSYSDFYLTLIVCVTETSSNQDKYLFSTCLTARLCHTKAILDTNHTKRSQKHSSKLHVVHSIIAAGYTGNFNFKVIPLKLFDYQTFVETSRN